MIGIDTNVLVRYIAQDDATQSALATQLLENDCSPAMPAFVGLVVLVELVWVSQTCYGASRKDVAGIVRQVLRTRQLVVQEAETAWKALRLFESSNADFADCLIAQIASAAGCSVVMTFDKAAANAGMRILE